MNGNYTIINPADFDGFFKDILLYLQSSMGFIPVLMLVKPTTTLDELVAGVSNDLFDTVMTSISINAERVKIVDFSKALLPSSYRVMIRKPDSFQSDHFFFLKPFSWLLWLLILATIPYVSIILWFCERNNNMSKKKLSVGSSIGYVICVLVGRTHPYIAKTKPGRYITYSLYILQIILIAVYTAGILSSLIVQRSEPTISGIDDIKNGKVPPNRVGILVGSTMERYYLNSVSHGEKNYYPIQTINELYTSVINDIVDLTMWSTLSTEYHVNNIYCDLMTVGVEFGESLYQMPVKKDWLYTPDLNSNIFTLIESEELDRISKKWFEKSICPKVDLSNTKIKNITIKTMSGLFILFFIISTICILIHLLSKYKNITINKIKRIFRRNNETTTSPHTAAGRTLSEQTIISTVNDLHV